MTVIAWDGRTLAADRLTSAPGGIGRVRTKIERFDNHLIASTGELDVALEMRAWFKNGAIPSEFPERARADVATLIVVSPGIGVRSWHSSPYPMQFEAEKIAFGSGRDYAEAAMYLGHDARRAVEVAPHFQTDCGNGVDVLTLSEQHA